MSGQAALASARLSAGCGAQGGDWDVRGVEVVILVHFGAGSGGIYLEPPRVRRPGPRVRFDTPSAGRTSAETPSSPYLQMGQLSAACPACWAACPDIPSSLRRLVTRLNILVVCRARSVSERVRWVSERCQMPA